MNHCKLNFNILTGDLHEIVKIKGETYYAKEYFSGRIKIRRNHYN